jgi:glucose-6-phosphate isomerase
VRKSNYSAVLGSLQEQVNQILLKMEQENILSRIWQHDYTVWKNKPEEISNRLGWLHSVEEMQQRQSEMADFADQIRSEKFKQVLLLGMGGSSLAPEVFRKIFGVQSGYLDLAVLDSTHPEAVLHFSEKFNPEQTLYLISTKSGGTVETISFFKYFYNYAQKMLGTQQAEKHFAAITDPGSGLEELARQLNFRKIFLNDPNIGGRYSALTYFGLVPATLVGIDLTLLLQKAREMSGKSGYSVPPALSVENPAALLGAIMGAAAETGRDKISFILSPSLIPFAAWIEQLIAESTGKEGNGLLPVISEDLLHADFSYNDRLFVQIKLGNDQSTDNTIRQLQESSQPMIQLILNDIYDLGEEFLLWEMATAIAGWCLKINPFDQPNVESAKVLARKMVDSYQKKGYLPEVNPVVEDGDIKIFSSLTAKNIPEVFENFFRPAATEQKTRTGKGYIALQVYLAPDEQLDILLQELRSVLFEKFQLATTVGYGPRFLHSTGQLHKGDAGHGLFVQFSADIEKDIPIPDKAGEDPSFISFGVLLTSQYLGDYQALQDAGRRVLRIHLGRQPLNTMKKIIKIISSLSTS